MSVCYGSIVFLFNPLNAELNSICHLLALLGARHILHVSRVRVKYILARRHSKFKCLHQLCPSSVRIEVFLVAFRQIRDSL